MYMQASWGSFEAQSGNPAVGLQLIGEARQDVHGNRMPDIALVWLEVMEAAALADAHDDRALDALKHAEQRLSNALACDSIWPWLFRFDERKLTAYRAIVSAKLGRAVAAKAAFESLGTDVQAPKTRALADLAYAEVLAAQGDVERACVIAGRAVEDGAQYGSDRILHTAARLRSRLGDRRSEVVASF